MTLNSQSAANKRGFTFMNFSRTMSDQGSKGLDLKQYKDFSLDDLILTENHGNFG